MVGVVTSVVTSVSAWVSAGVSTSISTVPFQAECRAYMKPHHPGNSRGFITSIHHGTCWYLQKFTYFSKWLLGTCRMFTARERE